MARFTSLFIAGFVTFGVAQVAQADTQLDVGPSIVLTDDQDPDFGDLTAKIKLVRLGSGWLVSAYGDAGSDELIYDVKAQAERKARDIYVRRCNANMGDCGDIANWSAPINIAKTASQTSASTAWKGAPGGRAALLWRLRQAQHLQQRPGGGDYLGGQTLRSSDARFRDLPRTGRAGDPV